MVEWLHVVNGPALIRTNVLLFLVIVESEEAMLYRSEQSLSFGLVSFRERTMHNPNTTASVDAKTNQDSNCGKIAFYEITCSIKRINPDNGIFDIEFFEVRACCSNLWIGSSQLLNVVLAFFM